MDDSAKVLAGAVLELDQNGRLSPETNDALVALSETRDNIADEVTYEVVPDPNEGKTSSKPTNVKKGSSS